VKQAELNKYTSYTMRGQLLNAPVASVTCLHFTKADFAPLKMVYGIIMNWDTGLIHCKRCRLPVIVMVQNCCGCEENFWGLKREGDTRGCIECEDYI
jgi:hypothetical protein